MLKTRIIPCLDVADGRIIGDGRIDRIARIAQTDEIDAFDNAAVGHVEAGDDTGFQHG